MLPGAFGKIGVAVLQIRLGNLQIDRGLFARFIAGIQKALSFLGIFGVKASLPICERVERIKDPVPSREKVIPLFHRSFS
jgi:hypothetical protein